METGQERQTSKHPLWTPKWMCQATRIVSQDTTSKQQTVNSSGVPPQDDNRTTAPKEIRQMNAMAAE